MKFVLAEIRRKADVVVTNVNNTPTNNKDVCYR